MRVSSDLLYRFVRSVGTGDASPDEVQLELPPVLNPIVSVPGPLANAANPSGTVLQRDSFRASTTTLTAATSGAGNGIIATLARGLWEVYWHLDTATSFTQVYSTDQPFHAFSIRNPGTATDLRVAAHVGVADVPRSTRSKFVVLFQEDSWSLVLQTQATVVGQTAQGTLSVIVNRLN